MTTATLFNFSPTAGSEPVGGLFQDASGNLFGTTYSGGANNEGTIFEIAKTASGYVGTPVTLADFVDFGSDIAANGFLISDAQGNLFGTTSGGGANGVGTVFELAKMATGYAQAPSILTSFGDATGFSPNGPLTMDSAGDLFGTTLLGAGGLFEVVKTASGYASTPTILAVPTASQQAQSMVFSPPVIDSAGNLFGVGQGTNSGEVFELVKTASGYASAVTVLATLPGGYEAGSPTALAMDGAGDLFGTTTLGAIFEIVKTASGYSSTPLTIATVSGYYFGSISTTLTLDQNGDIFGTSSSASADNRGVVFEIAKTGSGYATPIILQSFTTVDGTPRNNGVILDSSGDLLGVATDGTGAPGGAVYDLAKTPNGYAPAFSSVAVFGQSAISETIGSAPTSGLVLDAAGNLLGTTYSGGSVFEIAKAGAGHASTAHYLSSIDGNIVGSLVVDAAGNLIGTTEGSAGSLNGSVFEIAKTANGYADTATVLTTFSDGGATGYGSSGGVVVDSTGNLIGATSFGGSGGGGTIFEIAKTASGYASSPTALVNFAQGTSAGVSVALDSAGNLFGTTLSGGANQDATIFEVVKTASGYASSPTTLVTFDLGVLPVGPLTMDAKGDLFGAAGESSGKQGIVFELVKTASGYDSAPTILASVDDSNGGSIPTSGLLVDAAGDLFGTTAYGGAYGKGTVFEIAKTADGYASTPKILQTFDGTNGSVPEGSLVADASGTLYGTTSQGGANGGGAVFEITDSGYQVPVLSVSAALAAEQGGQVIAIADSSANVTGNLASLHALVSSGTSTAITFTDTTAPSITLSGSQLSSDADVVSSIQSAYSLTVTGSTTASGLAAIPVADIANGVAVTDSSANVGASLDTLEADAAAGKLSSITLTDGGIPTLSISAGQISSDAAALKDISGAFTLVETAPSTSATIVGAANALGNKVVFSGGSSQYTITASGDGAHFTVSEGGITDTLSNIQALQFSDLTLIAAQVPGTASVTTGNVAELYGAAFGRIPDVAGLGYYQQQLAASPSLSLFTLARYFLSSPEYAGSHSYAEGSVGDAQFITDSYANLLGRAPDAGAVDFYQKVINQAVQGLTSGTAAYAQAELQGYATVLTYFSQSAEFLGDVQVTAQNSASSQHWLVLI